MSDLFSDDISQLVPDTGSGADSPKYKPVPKVSEDDPMCQNEGVTDEGVTQASRLKSILSAGVLALNVANSLRMAKLQRDLGRRYLELAEEHRRYYNERFKPLEISLTQEALALPLYVRDKEQLNTGQMLISARLPSAGAADAVISCTGRYCTGQRAAILTDQLLKQATVESMAAGLAHRYTDKEEITRNNLRWDKREQVMKIGRDIPTEAVSYASLAAGIFGSLGEQAGKAAEGAMSFLAYNAERGQTQYPPRRGPMQVGTYRYIPTELEEYSPKPRETYKQPEPPTQTIRVMG